MKHFLITRFNLKNKHWQKNGEEYIILTKEWLDHRFTLFETYCFPSVLNQTNQNFIWLVVFDHDTPKIYRKRIQSIFANSDNFCPIFIDGYDSLLPALKAKIKQLSKNQNEYIITTRLDNDDILHQHFVQTIQDLFKPTSDAIIDLRCGYQLTIEDNTFEARALNSAFNPFISLIESVSNFETVFSREHWQWQNIANEIVNANHPLWIQLIHDKNKSNKKDYTMKRIAKLDLLDFGINLKPVKNNPMYITIYNILYYPYRLFMSTKKKLKYYITK